MTKYCSIGILLLVTIVCHKQVSGQQAEKPVRYFMTYGIKGDIQWNRVNPTHIEKIVNELSALPERNYPVQMGAFKSRENAERFYEKIKGIDGEEIVITEESGFFKVKILRVPPAGYKIPEPVTSAVKEEGLKETVVKEPVRDTTVPELKDTLPVPIALEEADTAEKEPEATAVTAEAEPVTEVKKEEQKQITPPDFLFIKGDSPLLKKINYYGKSYGLVYGLILSIIISIATMIILLIFILFNRVRIEKREKLRQELAEEYQSLIVDYLYYDISPEKFREIASDKFRRQVLIDQMIDVGINLKGETSQKLNALYRELGLHLDSIKRAHDFRWHKKIKGFRELSFMNIKDANPEIYKALNSSNEILRMEAQIALVRLSDKEPFEFLSHLTKPFSLWEQITLHQLIIQHNIPVPLFKKWLNSTNPTVVMFALRMIREFKQYDAEYAVRQTLLYDSPAVRQLAVQVAGDLKMRSTLDTMKRIYKEQDYNTCLEIIRAMGKMPDPSYLGFLKLVLDKEDDVQIQIEAVKAIENNGEEGIKELVKLMKSEYKNYNIIIRHVLDRRIY